MDVSPVGSTCVVSLAQRSGRCYEMKGVEVKPWVVIVRFGADSRSRLLEPELPSAVVDESPGSLQHDYLSVACALAVRSSIRGSQGHAPHGAAPSKACPQNPQPCMQNSED